jgi:hypothetical protein
MICSCALGLEQLSIHHKLPKHYSTSKHLSYLSTQPNIHYELGTSLLNSANEKLVGLREKSIRTIRRRISSNERAVFCSLAPTEILDAWKGSSTVG